jgi:hypothetical protein
MIVVVSTPSQPLYEKLAVLVAAHAAVIVDLRAQIAELETQLRQNSPNSSRPPSSDSAPADNVVQAGQAACRYSWMMPPSRSCRRMSRSVMWCG